MEEQAETKKLTLASLYAQLEAQRAEIAELKAKQDNYRPLGTAPKITPTDKTSKIVRADHPPVGGAYIVSIPHKASMAPWSGERMGVVFRNGIGIIDAERPDCDSIAHWMEADYRYKVIPATEAEVTKVRRMLDGMPVQEKQESVAEKLLNVGQL